MASLIKSLLLQLLFFALPFKYPDADRFGALDKWVWFSVRIVNSTLSVIFATATRYLHWFLAHRLTQFKLKLEQPTVCVCVFVCACLCVRACACVCVCRNTNDIYFVIFWELTMYSLFHFYCLRSNWSREDNAELLNSDSAIVRSN